ncbi:MAG: ATP-binding protein, partial [Planctomycetota bacterium]
QQEERAASAEQKALEAAHPDPRERERLREHARLGARPHVALEEIVGQERAIEALVAGLSTEAPGFHIFVAGPAGSGRETLVRAALAKHLPPLPRARDRVYVANFRRPDRPRLLTLPRGKGRRFVRDLDDVVAALWRSIPAALTNDAHVARVERLKARTEKEAAAVVEDLAAELRAEGYIVGPIPEGYSTPRLRLQVPGEPKPLPVQTVRRRIEEGELKGTRRLRRALRRYDEALARLEDAAGKARAIVRQGTLAVRRLQAQEARAVARGFTDDIAHAYPTEPVRRWLDTFLEAIGRRVELFLELSQREEEDEESAPQQRRFPKELALFRANLFVDAFDRKVPPVLFEANPSYRNMFGSLDGSDGLPDHMRLRAGSLPQAGGGVVVVDAAALFNDATAWNALKRSVLSGWLEVQHSGGASRGTSLRPEPIRMAAKVIAIGSEELYQQMFAEDPDFAQVFKVLVQLEGSVARTKRNLHLLARALLRVARRSGLRSPDASALARLLEHSARLACRNDRLQLAFSELLDVLQEADRLAAAGPRKGTIRAVDVDDALARRRRRHDLSEREAQQALDDRSVLLEVEGERVGVANALVVYDEGPLSYSRPTRVSAVVGVGSQGVVDVEQVVGLSGDAHHKGVTILAGILRERFAQDKPLCLTATVCFEQSYETVEGDSASLAETLAVFSALGDAPLSQAWGITGSLNQKGEVQVVGDVNAKIEGFFDACLAGGLNGHQGVIIPEGNLRDLMLRPDVVRAVAQRRFHVVSVRTLDEALELLCGLPAGTRPSPFEPYPEGSLNARVDRRLASFAEAARRFATPAAG